MGRVGPDVSAGVVVLLVSVASQRAAGLEAEAVPGVIGEGSAR